MGGIGRVDLPFIGIASLVLHLLSSSDFCYSEIACSSDDVIVNCQHMKISVYAH
jgi:hypothetical protein